MSEVRVVPLSGTSVRRSCDVVADLHIASIHHGLLPELGRTFLSRLYLEIDRVPRAGVWVAVDSDRVVGFIAGSADAKRCYRTVLLRAGPSLLRCAGRSLLRRSVLSRIPGVLVYPFRRPDPVEGADDVPPAELLAIAVAPEARGQGVGRRLVDAFEAALLTWGMTDRYRVATNVEEVVSNRFYTRAGFVPAYTSAHNDLTLQVYIKTLELES